MEGDWKQFLSTKKGTVVIAVALYVVELATLWLLLWAGISLWKPVLLDVFDPSVFNTAYLVETISDAGLLSLPPIFWTGVLFFSFWYHVLCGVLALPAVGAIAISSALKKSQS